MWATDLPSSHSLPRHIALGCAPNRHTDRRIGELIAIIIPVAERTVSGHGVLCPALNLCCGQEPKVLRLVVHTRNFS